MNAQSFLKLLAEPGRTNFFVICADELGLNMFLQQALAPIACSEDISHYDAEGITKEKARQIEVESRMAPRGGSKLNHFFIYSLQKLPHDSMGPLLKAVEEAKYSRFIFQAQSTPRKSHTLMSRSQVVRLPFFSRKVVLGNMKALSHDAKTADSLGLYDGTLGGTIRSLAMKDTMTSIQRDMKQGMRGLPSLFTADVLGSLAFEAATYPHMNEQERAYLDRYKTPARQKLALLLALQRIG